MNLFLMRHGIAEGDSPTGRDADRRLTAEGEQKLQHVARGMKALGLSFNRILTSPWIRARRTADIVAERLDAVDRIRETSGLIWNTPPSVVIEEIREEHHDVESLLLVGHEPFMSSMISILLTGRMDVRVTMKKAAVCRLTVGEIRPGRCGSLEWLMGPKHLASIR